MAALTPQRQSVQDTGSTVQKRGEVGRDARSRFLKKKIQQLRRRSVYIPRRVRSGLPSKNVAKKGGEG